MMVEFLTITAGVFTGTLLHTVFMTVYVRYMTRRVEREHFMALQSQVPDSSSPGYR